MEQVGENSPPCQAALWGPLEPGASGRRGLPEQLRSLWVVIADPPGEDTSAGGDSSSLAVPEVCSSWEWGGGQRAASVQAPALGQTCCSAVPVGQDTQPLPGSWDNTRPPKV